MVQTLFYINNSQVEQPKNMAGFCIELNYGKDQFPQGNVVSITNFEWVRENYDWFMTYINSGLTGGLGIFEAPAFRIDLFDGTTTKTVFDGYIDLTQGLQVKDRIKLTAKATSHATVDWINEVASSFTFEYLASLPAGAPGRITNANYRYIPYVNNSVPNYQQAAIATLMVYTIEQAIQKEIESIIGIVADCVGYFTTIPAIVKLIVKIAYLIILIITLIKLIKDLIKFIISPVKYHAGMYVKDLLAKGCEYLGMTFESDIYTAGSAFLYEFIIPPKYYNPVNATDNSLLGFMTPAPNEQVGWWKGTFGSLLDAIKTKYNAKIVVTTDNRVILIRKDKNAQAPVYQLPDLYIPEYTYNTDELKANTLIEFQTDTTETNTLQNYSGTIFQVICQPAIVQNQAFVMMKNFDQITVPFARASKKTGLTVPEKLIDDFLEIFDSIANVIVTVVNTIIGIVNDIIALIKKIFRLLGLNLNIPEIPTMEELSLGTLMDNRIGMMVLSADNFNVPKIFLLTEGSESKYNKISTNNDLWECAKTCWDGFYYVNSFIPTQLQPSYTDRPTGNQFIKKNYPKYEFTWQNFLDVVQNNRCYAADGTEAVLESLKFYPNGVNESGTAEGVFRFGKIYTLNLKETFLIPDGR